MKQLFKYFLLASLCLFTTSTNIANAEKAYKPEAPVEKISKSLSSVERKVRAAAVKVVTSGGHGSGTVVEYKDLTLVLTAKHVADGVLGSNYLVANEDEQRSATLVYQSKEHDVAVLLVQKEFRYLKPMPWKPTKSIKRSVRKTIYIQQYPATKI